MNIVLKTGLALRCGQRTLELTRLLEDDEVQLEDVLTRKATSLRTTELLKRIWSGRYTIILSAAHVKTGEKSAQVRVGAVPADPQTLIDLSSIKDSWNSQIEYRLRYLKGLQAAHVSRGDRPRIAKVIASVAGSTGDLAKPSTSTVMRWARLYQTSDCNPLSLVDQSKVRASPRRLPDKVEEIVQSTLRTEYFTRAGHSLTHVHAFIQRELQVAVRNGELGEADAKVGFATVCRRANDVDMYKRIASREGDARARVVCRSTMDGAGAEYPLQRVEVDHTPLNWVVICDQTGLPLGRPLLTVMIDAASGYITGIYLSFYGPGVTSVAGVLRNSITPKSELVAELGLKNPWLSHGLADEFVLDNGLEFHSRAFKQMSLELGVDMTFCRVRTPWLKPHVERFFAGLDFLTLVSGRIHKRVANSMNLDPYKDASITFSDLIKGLMMYIVDVYPFQINQRKIAQPFHLFGDGLERCPPAIYPGSLDRLNLVSGLSKQLTVNQGGIELHGLPYGGPELLPLIKRHGGRFKTLCKWNPDNMHCLYVQNPVNTNEWIESPCRWGEYADGLSWNQHLLIRKFAREELAKKSAHETLWKARMELHDHWTDASRKKDRKSSLKAAQFAGVTSANVFKAAPAPTMTVTTQILTKEDVPVDSSIPDFEAFEMGAR